MYKLYKISDNKYHVLVAPHIVGDWYFDSSNFKKAIEISDWEEVFMLINFFLNLAEKNEIRISKIKVQFEGFKKTIDNEDQTLGIVFESFLAIEEDAMLKGLKMEFIGECIIDDETVVYCELMGIEIIRDNVLGISIFTRNFAYLPHNPVTKNEQYELWKHNAPKLAKTLSEFSKKTSLSLLTDGEYWRGGGAFNKEHPFYLMNAVIHGKKDPEDLDEFYMPFDLLDSNDLIV